MFCWEPLRAANYQRLVFDVFGGADIQHLSWGTGETVKLTTAIGEWSWCHTVDGRNPAPVDM